MLAENLKPELEGERSAVAIPLMNRMLDENYSSYNITADAFEIIF